jgi:UDP-glucose 4-epimerase
MNILVTGGAGYIGSHVVKELINNDNKVIVIDNLIKGYREAIDESAVFIEGNFGDKKLISEILKKYEIETVMHFAAYISVEESVKNPLLYWQNNFYNSIIMLNEMIKNNVKKIVFSSSAAVYGNPNEVPINENHPTNPINPYGRTKLCFENILKKYKEDFGIKYTSLRYFNAGGAGYGLGEDHNPETHLIPIIIKTALGYGNKVRIFGDDYDTKDGSCIRDYVHVLDIANAHIIAIGKEGIFNIGGEKGYSVKEIINLCKEITGKDFKVEISSRRDGDPAILVASNKKIKEKLGWKPKFGIEEIIKSAWDWHKNNPKGFKKY